MTNKIVAAFLTVTLLLSLLIPSKIAMAEARDREKSVETIYEKNQGDYDEVNDAMPNIEDGHEDEAVGIFNTDGYDSSLVKILKLELNKNEEDITYSDLKGITSIDIEELQKKDPKLKDAYIGSFDLLKEIPNLENINLGSIKFDNLDVFNELLYIKKIKINGCTFKLQLEEPFKDMLKNIKVVESKVDEYIESEGVVNRIVEINLKDATIDSRNMGFDIPEIYELTSPENLPDEDKEDVLDYEIVDNSDWILNDYRVETSKSDFKDNWVNLKIKLSNNNIEKASINIKVIIDQSLMVNDNTELLTEVKDEEEKIEEVQKQDIEEVEADQENTLPEIIAEDKTINIGEDFDRLDGITANDKEDGDITSKIKVVEDTVDINTAGEYSITYNVEDSNGAVTAKTIKVTVAKKDIDNPDENKLPVINAEDKIINLGDKFDPKIDVTALDKDGNDITNRIKILENTVDVNKVGIYIITYEVIDNDGESTRKTIEVSVVNKDEKPEKNEPPIINASNRSIKYGSKFDPLYGATAYDKEDGNITSKIVVDQNLVDTYTKGKYSVIYSVTDSNGIKATKVINVEVEDKELPINNAPVIYVKDQYITVGNEFNPYSIVSACDYEDGWISSKLLVIYNSVNTDYAGVYKVTYQVTDSLGYTSTKSIYVNVISKDNTRPTIYASSVTLPLGNKFNPYAMVSAYDKEDGWISGKIVIQYNYVNIYKVGKYDVGYSVTDSGGMKSSCVITISVKDSNKINTNKEEKNSEPSIYAENISIPINSKFNPLEWVVAIDKEDGDITNRIMVISNEVDTSKEGNYHVTYEIIDKGGSKTNKVIMVYVKKEEEVITGNIPPKIYATDIVLEKGSYYDPLNKVTALDEEDGNLTHKIIVKSNNVNVSKSGEYKVIFEVSDSMGEVSTKTINVTVKSGADLAYNGILIMACLGIVLVVLIVAIVFTKRRKNKEN